jgi:tRNA/tmRNA/rRNA uracil-C5-methylase (TrmA/RlmC/RlmD family)
VDRARGKAHGACVTRGSSIPRPIAGPPATILCGGALYSHIAYARQIAIKSDVIRDAFARLGRYPIEHPVEVAGSRDEGYRMRARFHVHGARAGFYREGTHQLCDAAATRQMGADAMAAVTQLASALDRGAGRGRIHFDHREHGRGRAGGASNW